MSPDACLYLSKNKQTEVINKNRLKSESNEIDVLARVRRRAPSWVNVFDNNGKAIKHNGEK